MSGHGARQPDWRQPSQYAFTGQLSAAQWAWEFLRRNPAYIADWTHFIETWRALEADYGKPPNRDFAKWKNDPRAWVRVDENAAGDCRVDADRVFIECDFSARWGYIKLPVDPVIDDPVGTNRLIWRDIQQQLPVLDADSATLGGESSATKWATLSFRIDLPLAEQLEEARRLLLVLQRQRVKSGTIQLMRVSNLRSSWLNCLRLLDSIAAKAVPGEVVEQLFEGDEKAFDDCSKQAFALRDHDYTLIARLPD